MAFTPISALNYKIAALPDRTTGRAAYIKQYFDGNAEQLMAAFNALITALNAEGVAVELGAVKSGSDNMKYLRLNDGSLEASSDGEAWVTVTSGSGGHVIYNSDGEAMPQRAKFKFAGGTLSDDGTYTIIQNINGADGADGADGQSAYAAAQAGGYTGTQADFYADLAAMSGLAAGLEALL